MGFWDAIAKWVVKREQRHDKSLESRARPEVFRYLDEVYSEEAGQGSQVKAVVEVVESLMNRCDQSTTIVLTLYDAWHRDRQEKLEAAGDDEGQRIMSALQLHIAIVGMGNLFGLVPNGAPSYDPELAIEGVSRGWRPP